MGEAWMSLLYRAGRRTNVSNKRRYGLGGKPDEGEKMKINYKILNGVCKTKCPHKIEGIICGINKVGSIGCLLCKHRNHRNHNNIDDKSVDCGWPKVKS